MILTVILGCGPASSEYKSEKDGTAIQRSKIAGKIVQAISNQLACVKICGIGFATRLNLIETCNNIQHTQTAITIIKYIKR